MNPEVIAAIACGLFLSTPIVWILTKHQQKMTQLIHGGGGQNSQLGAEVNQLRQDMQEMKQLMHQQAIAMDNLQRGSLPPKEHLTEVQP